MLIYFAFDGNAPVNVICNNYHKHALIRIIGYTKLESE